MEDKIIGALCINARDNVVTVLEEVKCGEKIIVRDKNGKTLEEILALENIPRGHKIALIDMAVKSQIVKYGEVLGAATSDIKKGQWVHVHNIESLRGRGDKND